jgi:putative heme-binding domain-containing protein
VVGQSQFDQVHDDWGRRFLSWNTIPFRQQLLPDWFLEACPDLAALAIVDVAQPGDSGEIFPLSPLPRQFNSEGASFYKVLCGLTILRSPLLGSQVEGNAFVGKSLSNLVIRRELDATGVVARTQRPNPRRDFLASSDSWFHPVFLATGPDGALYLADFYRPLVEHPIHVASEQARREVDWRQGAERGRIWRVTRRGERQSPQPPVPPADLSPSELVARLDHPVGWQRDTARRVLVERRRNDLASDVRRVGSSAATARGRLQAMWTLEGLGELTVADLQRALADESDFVRVQGIALCGSRLAQDEPLRQACRNLAAQGSSPIRFQLALSSVRWQDEDRVELLKSLVRRAPGESPLTEVVLAVAARTPGQMLEMVRQLVREEPQAWLGPDEGRSRFLRAVGHRLGVGPLEERDSQGLETLLQLARDRREPAGVGWILAGMAESGVPQGKSLKEASAWKDPALVDWARGMLLQKPGWDHQPADPALWAAPLGLLVWGEADETVRELTRLVKRGQPAEVQSLAAFVIGEVVRPASVEELMGVWTEAGTPARRVLLRGAVRSLALGQMVLEGLRGGVISQADFPADLVVALAQSDSVDLRELAREVAPPVNTDRQQVVDARREALSQRGNALAGARLFRQHCLICHQVQREGGAVGPDLSGIGGRPRESVLVDLLDPNRQVNPNFVVQSVELKSGVVVSGLVVAETAQALVLKRADGGIEQIPVAGIVEVRGTGQSLMPEGFEQKLVGASLVEGLEFLGNPSRDLLREASRDESWED